MLMWKLLSIINFFSLAANLKLTLILLRKHATLFRMHTINFRMYAFHTHMRNVFLLWQEIGKSWMKYLGINIMLKLLLLKYDYILLTANRTHKNVKHGKGAFSNNYSKHAMESNIKYFNTMWPTYMSYFLSIILLMTIIIKLINILFSLFNLYFLSE